MTGVWGMLVISAWCERRLPRGATNTLRAPRTKMSANEAKKNAAANAPEGSYFVLGHCSAGDA